MRLYQLHQDQHRPPPDPGWRRGLRIRPGLDGTAKVEIVLEASEAEELAAVIQAFIDRSAVHSGGDDQPGDESAAADEPGPGGVADRAVDQSAAADSVGEPEVSWPARRADAFMDILRTALAHAGEGQAAGADRYLVHLVRRGEITELIDGTPLDAATAGRITCDGSTVTHVVGDDGEPLYLGRKTRQWSTAQRRAVLVRDDGHCRFPGCQRRFVDLHHQWPWEDGGPTDIDNGFLACGRHHTLLHRGFSATGDPNHALTFHRPDGSDIGATGAVRS